MSSTPGGGFRSVKHATDISFIEWWKTNVYGQPGTPKVLSAIDVDQVVFVGRDFPESKRQQPQPLFLIEAKRERGFLDPKIHTMEDGTFLPLRTHSYCGKHDYQLRLLQELAKALAVPLWLVLYEPYDDERPLPDRADDSTSVDIEWFATAMMFPQVATHFKIRTAAEYRAWLCGVGKGLKSFNARDENKVYRRRLNRRRDGLLARLCEEMKVPHPKPWVDVETFQRDFEDTPLERTVQVIDEPSAEDPIAADGKWRERQQGFPWGGLPYGG